MKLDNIILEKSFAFSVRMFKVYDFLINKKMPFKIAEQLLKSGTSIGANVEEAIGAHSPVDFLSKITISYKEARETHYWIRLFKASGYFNEEEANSLLNDCTEILKILTTIQKTKKENIRQDKIQKLRNRKLKVARSSVMVD